MFDGCKSLGEIDLSNFNGRNINNINEIFNNCDSVKVINLSNFNAENLIDMSIIFYGLKNLEELDISDLERLMKILVICLMVVYL